MKKIIFLHGFFASGNCIPAITLKEQLAPDILTLTPDLPLHPKDALAEILQLCKTEQPDLLVGNSCGAFYAQLVAAQTGLPALLGNPHLQMTEFLKERIGEHQYKSPRANGCQHFVIDQQLIEEFAEMQQHQFDTCQPEQKERVWGLFGENDGLAHFEPVFKNYYDHSFHFPGGHTPTADEVALYYAPLVREMLSRFS